MNFGRVAAAALVAWIVSIVIAFLVNDVLLVDILQANALAMRPQEDMTTNLPLGFAFMLVGFFAFAYAYAKGYEGGDGVLEGVRFGVLTAFIVGGFGVVWQYVLYPISGAMALGLLITGIVSFAIYGAVVGAIYRPDRPWR